MSHHFRLKYNEMREGDPSKTQANSPFPAEDEDYARASNVRNVCFVLSDGHRIFLNYGYLVAGQYFPAESLIRLSFTSHTVMMTGVRLEPLFYEFMQHLPRQIACTDERYNAAAEDDGIVNSISIKQQE